METAQSIMTFRNALLTFNAINRAFLSSLGHFLGVFRHSLNFFPKELAQISTVSHCEVFLWEGWLAVHQNLRHLFSM